MERLGEVSTGPGAAPLDVHALLGRMTMEVIGRSAFGCVVGLLGPGVRGGCSGCRGDFAHRGCLAHSICSLLACLPAAPNPLPDSSHLASSALLLLPICGSVEFSTEGEEADLAAGRPNLGAAFKILFASGAFTLGEGIGILFRLLPDWTEPLIFYVFFSVVVGGGAEWQIMSCRARCRARLLTHGAAPHVQRLPSPGYLTCPQTCRARLRGG